MNNTMDKLLDLVCVKLDEIANARELNATLTNELDTLIDIKKDILEIKAMEEYSYNDYSNMNGNSYGRMMPHVMYNNKYGYPHGQVEYYNELMNGGYSGDNMSGNSYGNMNRNYSNSNYNSESNGYSRGSAEDEMMSMLQNMANNANSNEKRDMYHRFMNELERMK